MIKPEIIPVIHSITYDQVRKNVETCIMAGIRKVFLVDYGSGSLLDFAKKIKEEYSFMWVGLNFLGMKPEEALQLPFEFDGLWLDETVTDEAASLRTYQGQVFGGCAFKYQKDRTADLRTACEQAARNTDVATTSGIATGKAPTVVKIASMRFYLGNHPMAIASGIDQDNIKNLSEFANYFLVASSITDSEELIDLQKLMVLKSRLNEEVPEEI